MCAGTGRAAGRRRRPRARRKYVAENRAKGGGSAYRPGRTIVPGNPNTLGRSRVCALDHGLRRAHGTLQLHSHVDFCILEEAYSYSYSEAYSLLLVDLLVYSYPYPTILIGGDHNASHNHSFPINQCHVPRGRPTACSKPCSGKTSKSCMTCSSSGERRVLHG